jgi:hypothetical protein
VDLLGRRKQKIDPLDDARGAARKKRKLGTAAGHQSAILGQPQDNALTPDTLDQMLRHGAGLMDQGQDGEVRIGGEPVDLRARVGAGVSDGTSG